MNLEEIKDYIIIHYDSECFGVPYETGNFDDTYIMGKEHGQAELLYRLGIALGLGLHKPEYSEDNYLYGVV